MWIELCGIPGCGKTTVNNEIRKELTSQGASCYSFHELSDKRGKRALFKIISAMKILRPLDCCYCLQLFHHNGLRLNKNLLRRVYMFQRMAYCRKRYSVEKNCVIDQGLIQQLVSFFYTKEIKKDAVSKRMIQKLFRYAGSESTAFIGLNCPVETAISRLRSRGGVQVRVQALNDKELSRALRVQTENFAFIQTCLREAGCKMLNCSTEVPSAETAEAILRNITIIKNTGRQ